MQKSHILISSEYMRDKLKDLKLPDDEYVLVLIGINQLNIAGIAMECHCKTAYNYQVDCKSVERLIKFLKIISDQPLGLRFGTNSWIEITEALL